MTLRNVVLVRAGLGPNGDYGSSTRNFECVDDRMESEESKCAVNSFKGSSERGQGMEWQLEGDMGPQRAFSLKVGAVKARSHAHGHSSVDMKTPMVAGERGRFVRAQPWGRCEVCVPRARGGVGLDGAGRPLPGTGAKTECAAADKVRFWVC